MISNSVPTKKDTTNQDDPVKKAAQLFAPQQEADDKAAQVARLFAAPSKEADTQKEDTIIEAAKNKLDEVKKAPPIKFRQEDEQEQPPKSPLLDESEQELGLDAQIPFPQLPNSAFNTAAAVSTGVAPVDEQGVVDIHTARERVAEMVEGFDTKPVETQRRITELVSSEYDRVIEEKEEAGDKKQAAKLRDEKQTIEQYHDFLLEKETIDFEREHDFFTQTGQQLKKGALGLMLSLNGSAISNNKILSIYDEIDRTGRIPNTAADDDAPSQFSGVGRFTKAERYLDASPEQREQLKAAELENLAVDIADIKEIRKAISAIPTHPKAEKFLAATSFNEVWQSFLDAPFAVATEVAFANLPQMSGVLGAAAIGAVTGGPAGAAAAGGAASTALEYGNLILEELSRAGIDIDDEEKLMQAVQNEELMKRVKANARTGSTIVGLLDAGAIGLAATRFIPKGTLDDIVGFIGREAYDEAIQVTGQGLLGGLGAGVSELARTGQVSNVGEIGAEVLGEGAFAPLRTFGIRSSIRNMEINRARHSILEYVATDEILKSIRAQRNQAVEQGRASDVRRADRLAAEVRERRQKMVDEQRQRLVEHRDRLEQRVRDMENKRGAKALRRTDFKTMVAELDAINKMLQGDPVFAEQQTETQTGEEDATRTTTPVQEESQAEPVAERDRGRAAEEAKEEETQEEAEPEQAADEDTAGESGEQQPVLTQITDVQGEIPTGDTIGIAALSDDGTLYVGQRGDAHINLLDRFNIEADDVTMGFVDSDGNFMEQIGGKRSGFTEAQEQGVGSVSYDTAEQAYAESIGIDPESIDELGSGEFGTAYATPDGRVIKKTTSATEAELAKRRMEQGEDSNFATILDVKKVDDGFIILQEELEQDSDIEDNIATAQMLLEDQDLNLATAYMFDPDEVSDDMQGTYEDIEDFINDLSNISDGYRRLGVTAQDIQADNLGYDADGNLKAFDLDDKARELDIDDVDVETFSPTQQETQPAQQPQQPMEERLQNINQEIEQFENLENPTAADNDYLTYLRDEQERLQARIRNSQEERQQERPSPIPPAQQQVGITNERIVDLLEQEVGSKIKFRAEATSGTGERETHTRVLRKDDGGYYVEFRGDKRYVNARSLLGENIPENATLASHLIVEPTLAVEKGEVFENVDPNAARTARELNENGMPEVAEEVINKSSGKKVEQRSKKVSDGHYKYRGFDIVKEGDFWTVEKRNGTRQRTNIDDAPTIEIAQSRIDSWISGQADAATGQELGQAINPNNLHGTKLPKSGVAPANKVGDNVYVGGLLDNHGSIAATHGLNPEQVQIETGFVTPDGRYLTREQTVDYVEQQKIRARKTGEGTPQDKFYSEQIIPEKESPKSNVVPKEYKQNGDTRQQTTENIKKRVQGPNIDNWGVKNTIVTKEQADQIRQQIYQRFGRLNMGIDPKMLSLSAKLAIHHIEAGVREFSDFARIMINEVGKQVIPKLRELYNEAIKRGNFDRAEFTDKPEIDRFFLEYHKNSDEEVFSIEDAETFVQQTTEFVDKQVKSQLQHKALTELAKAYHNQSQDVNTIVDFIEAVRENYPNQFNRNQMQAAWSAARSNAEERRRFWLPELIHQKTGIPLHVLTFHHGASVLLRKKLQDSFIGQKKVQEQIKNLRGWDYFIQNEQLDAYLQEELIRGRVSELQYEVSDLENPNSTIRQILQIAKEENLNIADWREYYSTLRKAERARETGNEDLALKLEKEAQELYPNEQDDVQMYLHAKHAREANNDLVRQIEEKIKGYQLQLEEIPDTEENKRQRAAIKAQITRLRKQIPSVREGAGMSNERADEILQEFHQQGKTAALQRVAELIYQVNNQMLEMRRESGLNSDEEIDGFQERFNNYVPLNRILFDPYGSLIEQVGSSTVKGTDVASGAKFKRRRGSDRPVDNILATVMMNYDELIGDIERNNLLVSLAELYDSEWALGNDNFGRSVPLKSGENVDIATKLPFRIKREDGTVEDRMLIFNSASKLVHDALAEFNANKSDWWKSTVNTFRSFMNYLRFVRTSASVNFIFSNPQRDIGTVMGNMASDFGYGASLKFAKNIFYDKSRFADAQRSIWDYLKGKDTPGAREYQKLKKLGGTTGFYQLSDRADILKKMKNLEKQINEEMRRSGEPVRNLAKLSKSTFRKVIRGIELLNEVAENATRLTAYRMALENGYSERRAASYALNVNTNFNKSGDWGDLFKIGFQFANSAIQGHTRMLRAAKVDPKTFSKTALSLMALGAANSSFNDWMNEEAHRRLKRTRPWLFNNNLVFLDPDGDVMFKIYLPFGYNVFKAAGDITYDLSKGDITPEQAAGRFGNSVADSFNPFRGSAMFTGGVQGLMLAATPTALEPFTEMGVNQSFFGNIYPPFRHALQEELDIKDFQLKYNSVNPYMEYVTNFLKKHDIADISPETVEHMTYFLGGSVGREWINLFSKSLNTDKARREGINLYTRADGTEVKLMPNNVPVMSRFLNTVDKDRIAVSSIYETKGDLSTESFNVRDSEFEEVLNSISSDYSVLLTNDLYPDADKEVLQKSINSFVKSVFKNNMRDETVRAFREEGLTGEENKAARQRYYERTNRRVRTFRIPQLDRIDSANFRLLPFGTKRSKIFDKSIIEQIEVKVN